MKKLLVLVLVFVLLPVVSLSDLPDVRTFTDSELSDLNQMIQHEMFSRGAVKGVDVPMGSYTVGVDIPAGDYTITCSDISNFFVYLDEENFKLDYVMFNYLIGDAINDPTIGKVPLNDGNIVQITGTCTFKTYTGLFN